MRGGTLLITVALAIGSSVMACERPCRPNTIFVRYSLPSLVAMADEIFVRITIGNQNPRAFNVPRQTRDERGAFELDFGEAYADGTAVTLNLTARLRGDDVAGAGTFLTTASGCTAIELDFTGGGITSHPFDFAIPPDLPPVEEPDMAMPDLVPPPFCASVTVSTFTGNGVSGYVDGTGGATGTTQLKVPNGVAVDGAGFVYVADTGNSRIRKVAPDGTTTTLAGGGAAAFADGTGGPTGTARFNNPSSIAVDTTGSTIFVGDTINYRIRKLAADGTTTTLAGSGTSGFMDGTGGAAGTTRFIGPRGLGIGAANLFVVDETRIRKVALSDGATTTLAGNGAHGFIDGTGGAGGTTQFNTVLDGVLTPSRTTLHVTDMNNHRIRSVSTSDGTTTTLTGNGMGNYFDGTGGPTGTTSIREPHGITIDSATGYLYVTDGFNRIRRIAPDGSTVTVAGNPFGSAYGYTDGDGCSARFSTPNAIAVRGKQLFVADPGNNRIRVVTLP